MTIYSSENLNEDIQQYATTYRTTILKSIEEVMESTTISIDSLVEQSEGCTELVSARALLVHMLKELGLEDERRRKVIMLMESYLQQPLIQLPSWELSQQLEIFSSTTGYKSIRVEDIQDNRRLRKSWLI